MQDLPQAVAAVRRFSRFYTNRIGALHEGLLQSRFSLTEARVLFELGHRREASAAEIAEALGLDAGYLSRILQRFEREGLLTRTRSTADRRQSTLGLTDDGHTTLSQLDDRSCSEVARLLAPLPSSTQAELIGCMGRIQTLLGGDMLPSWTLRAPEPGDIGWVIERHAALYAAEYGFDATFEALVAQIAGGFLAAHDPERERCWIAERSGVRLGSVFLMRQSETVGKLRLLLVEPAARGLGIGRALVQTCIAGARVAGYRELTLWTNDVLVTARAIYVAAGFRLVDSKPYDDFGPQYNSETWSLDLG
jgi:DNA-binding MarR family transcriptional regulator/N-acetylglutamate synthase-like GNAT family acetyltransferase